MRMTHSPRTVSAGLKAGESGIGDDLGHAVVVAQVDEQQAAMVAHAVHPARQADGLADVGLAQVRAGVAAVAMHGHVLVRALVGAGNARPARKFARKSAWGP